MALSPHIDAHAGIEPYRLHVSQRWLDLTKRKLELARVPKVSPGTGESLSPIEGIAKEELVSLLDYWTDTYDHRVQEEEYNTRLPQFRTNLAFAGAIDTSSDIKVFNVHFAHRKSSFDNAIPLLICHDWGASFIEAARIVEGLCEPISTPTPERTSERAFHVVCPSVPGFAFSDASSDPCFGLEGTADILDALMKKLGYNRYMLHGSQWYSTPSFHCHSTRDGTDFTDKEQQRGYLICRTIALRHPDSCIAVHTAGLEVPRPTLKQTPRAWISYQVARLMKARFPLLSFGYVPSDFENDASYPRPELRGHQSPIDALICGTQAFEYALTDSPTGLLAMILGIIHCRGRYSGPAMQDPWSPAEIIMWTMIYWLPGPEAPLRWLRNAARECSPEGAMWQTYSRVALGVSHYRGSPPPAWTSMYQHLTWVRRHGRRMGRPAWEAPDELVMDIRAFAEETCV